MKIISVSTKGVNISFFDEKQTNDYLNGYFNVADNKVFFRGKNGGFFVNFNLLDYIF